MKAKGKMQYDREANKWEGEIAFIDHLCDDLTMQELYHYVNDRIVSKKYSWIPLLSPVTGSFHSCWRFTLIKKPGEKITEEEAKEFIAEVLKLAQEFFERPFIISFESDGITVKFNRITQEEDEE